MHQKYELGPSLNYFWYKNEKKIFLNFIFAFEPLRFWHTCHSFLLSKFASHMASHVVGSVASFMVLGSDFQDREWQGLVSQGLRIPGSQSPRSQVSWSKGLRVPGLRVLELRVWGSRVSALRSQVLILDYA